MKTCPYCKSEIGEESQYCERCGKQLPQIILCPQCGQRVEDDSVFCPYCGMKLKMNLPKEMVSDTSKLPKCVIPKIRLNGKWLYIVVGGIIILTVVCFLLFFDAPPTYNEFVIETKEFVLKEHHDYALEDGDGIEVDAHIDYPILQNAVSDSIKKWIKDVSLWSVFEEKPMYSGYDIHDGDNLLHAISYCCKGDACYHDYRIKKISESPLYVTFSSCHSLSAFIGNGGYYYSDIATFRKSDGHRLVLTDITDYDYDQLRDFVWNFPKEMIAGGDEAEKKDITMLHVGLLKNDVIFIYPKYLRAPNKITVPLQEAKSIFKRDFDLWNRNEEAVDYITDNQ